MNFKLFLALISLLFYSCSLTVSADEIDESDDIEIIDVAVQTEEEKEVQWKPSATEFDWVQLTSGEWLKGEIKSMYSDNLEFDSDKLDLLSIDMDDVMYLQSFQPCLVNIENLGSVKGVLNISNDKVSITNSDKIKVFDIIEVISFAPGGETESDLWWVKFTLGVDLKKGNTDQVDFSSQLAIKRRTATSNFIVDYIGIISRTNAVTGQLEETINNHRLNFTLDRYITRQFFYTPIFGEYFTDTFQNIENRTSLGIGIGYSFIHSDKTDWSVSVGPTFLSTEYVSVQEGDDLKAKTGSLSLSTDFDSELNNKIDLIVKYKIQVSDQESGGYTHHFIATLENELTKDFDLDVSIVWDRINSPTIDEDSITPDQDDFRFILGISYTY